MIRGRRNVCVAVRRPDGTIAHRCEPLSTSLPEPLRNIPFLRGVSGLVQMLGIGIRALTYSANVSTEGESREMDSGSVVVAATFTLAFAIGLFFVAPLIVSLLFEGPLGSDLASNLAEGVLRVALFLAYVYMIGKMPRISRVFMYHGAEHMVVRAQEESESLDVATVRSYPTAHPRCGTAFLLTIMLVAVAVFAFTGRDPLWWLVTSRIVLIPVIAAVAYEIVRFTATYYSYPLVRILAVPGLALQTITTSEPDDDQIEVATAAMELTIAADVGRRGVEE